MTSDASSCNPCLHAPCHVKTTELESQMRLKVYSHRLRAKLGNSKTDLQYAYAYQASVECVWRRSPIQHVLASRSSWGHACIKCRWNCLVCHAKYYLWPYFRYGLHAAMNLTVGGMALPCTRRSHITSLISPIASVVFASSKKRTVSKPWPFAKFCSAFEIARCTYSVIVLSVVPPWT